MTEQLNFFDRLEPTATILPFPPCRLLSLIEGAAERVFAAAAVSQPQTMLDEVGLLMLRYMLNGIDEDRAYQLAIGYEQAIIAEVHRLKWTGRRPDPRGVA